MDAEIEKLTKKVKTAKTKADGSKNVGVVLVRGMIGVSQDKKDTLKMLNLTIKNSCVVIKNTPQNIGMVKKVKDFVTYGEVNDETIKALSVRKKENKKEFRLNPPRHGYGRKGIKKSFSVKGALGYRGEKINDLIQRMI